MSRNKKRSQNRLGGQSYGSLEARQLLAGDVSVFQHDALLYIRGDMGDNQVQIARTADGDIQVTGTNGTTINGSAEAFVVDSQAGRIERGLRVNLGRGNDSLFVEGVSIEGRAVVYGGAGEDSIGFYDVNVDHDLFVQSGSGDDLISVDDVEAGALSVVTLGGDDLVGVGDSQVNGRTIILTGSGDDDVAISDSMHDGNAYIFTQGGNDFVGTDNVTISGLAAVVSGWGSDDVYVNDTTFNGRVYANGGFRATDNLEIDGETTFSVTPNVRDFEGDDVAGGQLQASQVFTDLIVDGARLGTITELAAITPELSTLVGALQTTGLDTALNGTGPFTVFAPLNSAFANISSVVESLTVEELSSVLQFHVTNGAIFASELVELTSVGTLLGQSFSVDVSSGSVVLNGNATLAATDIRAKNGVIHLLNDVLIPTL